MLLGQDLPWEWKPYHLKHADACSLLLNNNNIIKTVIHNNRIFLQLLMKEIADLLLVGVESFVSAARNILQLIIF